jgi:hypothetical protein
MGCDEQNGLPVSMGNMHRQPVWQGLLTPQLPPQVAEAFASLRNCRAETVPAQRTPMTSAVKNMDLIFFMIAFLLLQDSTPVPNGSKQKKVKRPQLLCRRLNSRGMRWAKARCGLQREGADAATLARFIRAAAAATGGWGLRVAPQLSRWNSSSAENSGDNGYQKRVLDGLSHHKIALP